MESNAKCVKCVTFFVLFLKRNFRFHCVQSERLLKDRSRKESEDKKEISSNFVVAPSKKELERKYRLYSETRL